MAWHAYQYGAARGAWRIWTSNFNHYRHPPPQSGRSSQSGGAVQNMTHPGNNIILLRVGLTLSNRNITDSTLIFLSDGVILWNDAITPVCHDLDCNTIRQNTIAILRMITTLIEIQQSWVQSENLPKMYFAKSIIIVSKI